MSTGDVVLRKLEPPGSGIGDGTGQCHILIDDIDSQDDPFVLHGLPD